MKSFDVIVAGVGSMGAATCDQLARRGVSVLGLERFQIGHSKGSHLGQSRLIRKAYFEHPDYVPLLQRAYELWDELEADTGTKLYHPTCLLYHGRPDQELIAGSLLSASIYNIPFQEISRKEQLHLFPAFTLPEDYLTYLEPEAGFLRPEKSIQVMADRAKFHGADLHIDEWMTDFVRSGDGWSVHTNRNVYSCQKLIITAGAWSTQFLHQLHVPLKVTRQVLGWLDKTSGPDCSLQNLPCWILADDHYGGAFYGFPELPEGDFGSPGGLKIAHHYPGFEIRPEEKDQKLTVEEKEALDYGKDKYLGAIGGSWATFQHCMYTMSPDEHFIIDQVPFSENVWFAAGFSGHGFKFSPVIGEIMADLALTGTTSLPVQFLSAARFS